MIGFLVTEFIDHDRPNEPVEVVLLDDNTSVERAIKAIKQSFNNDKSVFISEIEVLECELETITLESIKIKEA